MNVFPETVEQLQQLAEIGDATQQQVIALIVGELLSHPGGKGDAELRRLAATAAPRDPRRHMVSNFAVDRQLVDGFQAYCKELSRSQLRVLGWIVDYVFTNLPPPPTGGGRLGFSRLADLMRRIMYISVTAAPAPRSPDAPLPGQLALLDPVKP